jgi:Ca-activated chloride channel family protein
MRRVAWCLCSVAALALPASASAWSPLRGENSNAKKGNALMAQEQYSPALEAYDEAARELPDARAVQLNRGLALLAQDLGEQSKEAFLAAADPAASPTTRADAYYNLGIAYAREGDAISQQEEYEQASAHFREAADAFKRALRVRPGDRNAAWNLEYAMKRIREEEEKQDQQDQDQDQQDQDQQDQDQQDQDQQDQDQQDQDQQDQDQQDQDQQDQDQQDQDQQDQDQQDQESESENESGKEQEQQQPIPRDEVQRFLDALEQNEENLPLQRARRRNAGRPPPEKDW